MFLSSTISQNDFLYNEAILVRKIGNIVLKFGTYEASERNLLDLTFLSRISLKDHSKLISVGR